MSQNCQQCEFSKLADPIRRCAYAGICYSHKHYRPDQAALDADAFETLKASGINHFTISFDQQFRDSAWVIRLIWPPSEVVNGIGSTFSEAVTKALSAKRGERHG